MSWVVVIRPGADQARRRSSRVDRVGRVDTTRQGSKWWRWRTSAPKPRGPEGAMNVPHAQPSPPAGSQSMRQSRDARTASDTFTDCCNRSTAAGAGRRQCVNLETQPLVVDAFTDCCTAPLRGRGRSGPMRQSRDALSCIPRARLPTGGCASISSARASTPCSRGSKTLDRARRPLHRLTSPLRTRSRKSTASVLHASARPSCRGCPPTTVASRD